MATSVDASEIGTTYYDVITPITPDAIELRLVRQPREAPASRFPAPAEPSIALRFTAARASTTQAVTR